MTDLTVLRSGRGLSRIERRAAAEITATRAVSSVLAARESARLDLIADVAETALLNASDLSNLEAVLVMRTPHAAPRLGLIADSACIQMSKVVAQTGRSV
ncbi:MAG TPA: hypothetical protein VK680_13610 [Solirubrobacteraceae bacterium]|jgi:hypothetical protein|nr:hypothetical protein [Solirubrobacteraceae bacterium]